MSMIKNMITGSDKKKNLPPNRFLQFFYVIKENFLLMFYSSITYFVFILPLIYILLSSYLRFVAQLNTENIDSNSLLNTLVACGVLLIPCIIISSIGATGIHSIIVKLIYDDGCLYKDFFKGIKKNYKKFFPIYLFIAIFSFLLIVNYGVYFFVKTLNPTFKLITLILTIILLIMCLLIKPFYILQVLLFDNSNNKVVKNSLTLAIARLIPNILMFILSIILYVTLFFFSSYLLAINIVLLILFGGAFSTLINMLNAVSVLEKSIEPSQYKTLYHKGLADYKNENINQKK